MMAFFLEILFLSPFCGIIAAVYRNVLAYEPVMQWWFRWGNRFEKRWFFAPIWGCVRCISGQFGLWSFVLCYWLPWFHGELPVGIAPMLFGFLFNICGAILTAIIVARHITKISND